MAVINVTPDSFSDGGSYLQPEAAVARALEQRAAGADLVDVGGESTRPGATRVPADIEAARVLPVIRALVAEGVVVSIDTMRAEVAQAAVDAGAALVNDVSGGLADADMFAFLAESTVPCVLMHWRGHSVDMQSRARYPTGVVNDVRDELAARLAAATAAGIDPRRVVLDPGLGFAKEPGDNWTLLRDLAVLHSLGQPLLLGASRKRFLGELLADDDGTPRSLPLRDDATAAVSAISAHVGAWCVRVHESRASADAVRVASAWGGGS